MKAVILCAGLGKRLRPYTDSYQKSMILIHSKPLLEYIINGLIYAGFKSLIIVVGYRKEQIISYFKDGNEWGIKIEYIEQKTLNGTGGAVLECENLIQDSHFFLTWGDILVPYKIYKEVVEVFEKENQDYILVTNYAGDPYKGGAVYCKNDFLIDILEKPPKGSSKSNLNNCGIFIFSKEIFKVLHTIKPSIRGEIELTEALRIGNIKMDWRIRIIKMEINQFRGDFGDKNNYKKLSINSNWLKELVGNHRYQRKFK
ncbi:MAG: nucleotidyltransferase family protein [Candidatus Lokiarchaeota archaeon]|nr:nucleotidyltransferase family protein [Candidatus Lokiarchaeota archaeon]